MDRMTCAHCDRSFTPATAPDGEPEYTDADGVVCCDSCLCVVCGRGHATETEHTFCVSEFVGGEREAVDPDAAHEAARDLLIGV
jgi:hypothetical protein